eukprot:SAG11_NODE_9013_length_953_cov_2.010539_2_plen_75_part_01
MSVRQIWARIREILIGTGEGTCKRPQQQGQGLAFHRDEEKWDKMMDRAMRLNLPLKEAHRHADYALVFTLNPPAG